MVKIMSVGIVAILAFVVGVVTGVVSVFAISIKMEGRRNEQFPGEFNGS